MPGEPSVTTGTKSSGKVKRISIPRVQSGTDTELQSQQSGSTPLQTTVFHTVSFRTEVEESQIPPAIRTRLLDLFQQIEKEFEMLCAENSSCKFENFVFNISVRNSTSGLTTMIFILQYKTR